MWRASSRWLFDVVHFTLRQLHTCSLVFFFNDTATTEIYTLSLHDALPISPILTRSLIDLVFEAEPVPTRRQPQDRCGDAKRGDRKSTRLNSSHKPISYAVFCLKKKKITQCTCTDIA
mgnify:CR=1 FL=1